MEISLDSPPVIYYDNISALALASNPIFHAHSKHIEVDYHFVREKVSHRDIILEHISTSIQLEDIFTKGHTVDRFCFLHDKLAIYDLPASLRRNVCDNDNDPSLSLMALSYI